MIAAPRALAFARPRPCSRAARRLIAATGGGDQSPRKGVSGAGRKRKHSRAATSTRAAAPSWCHGAEVQFAVRTNTGRADNLEKIYRSSSRKLESVARGFWQPAKADDLKGSDRVLSSYPRTREELTPHPRAHRESRLGNKRLVPAGSRSAASSFEHPTNPSTRRASARRPMRGRVGDMVARGHPSTDQKRDSEARTDPHPRTSSS